MTFRLVLYRSGLVFLFLMIVSSASYGQPRPPDNDIPFTGLEWLLVGGGLWGAKKVYDLRKKDK